jgi:hypothetical protein
VNITIRRIANGLLVSFNYSPTPADPLAQRASPTSEIYAHDYMELLGYIAERVTAEFEQKG